MSERISDAEHAVMEVLWQEAPLSANDVADRLAGHRNWGMATIKTLLSRLMAKDAIAAEADGRRFLYQPLIARDDYVSGESRRLVDRLFGGRLSPLVAQLADQEALSEEDITEIEALLKRIRS
jgi:BlaI family transcriptional regulator, penicillinase repressor